MASAGLKFMRRTTNTHGKITERMKIFYQNLKIKSIVQKIQNYINKWVKHIRRTDKDGLPHLIISTM